MRASTRVVKPSSTDWVEHTSGLLIPQTPAADYFVAGETFPVCVEPTNPNAMDNVGWDGKVDANGVMGDPTQNSIQNLTVPANTTWKNRKIWANVTLTDATSRLENCIIFGSVYGGTRLGLVIAKNGGQLFRCTVYGMPKSVFYATNGIKHEGGLLTTERCVFMRVVDGVHTSGSSSARYIDKGSYFARFSFFDNDQDHANSTPAYWTHQDAFQALGPASIHQHQMIGSRIESFFDASDITWSGGSWGVGTASGGYLGTPATALNAGYFDPDLPELGTWSNGITLSNATGHKMLIDRIWINGVNASSGMVQFTTGSTNQLTMKGARIGLGGRPSGSGKFFIITMPAGSNANVYGTGTDANRFANNDTVPANLRGVELVYSATGSSSIVP
jgi:hypothetical protein